MYVFHEWRSYLTGTIVFWITAVEQSVNTNIYQWGISTGQSQGRAERRSAGRGSELNALHMEIQTVFLLSTLCNRVS